MLSVLETGLAGLESFLDLGQTRRRMEKLAHLVAVDEQQRRLSIYRVFESGERNLYTYVDFRLICLMQIAKLMRVFYDCLEKI
jgi:hypothetical protein